MPRAQALTLLHSVTLLGLQAVNLLDERLPLLG